MSTYMLLCMSGDNKRVLYDPVNSHAATHFHDTLQLKGLVAEVLGQRQIANEKLAFDLDMGRVIGDSDVVTTDKSDEIVYALRKNRREQGYVPFVKTKKPEPNTYLSISLLPHGSDSYLLSSAWIGRWDDPPFPQEPHATAASLEYWSRHAFVWGSQEIEPGSATPTKPW